MDLQISVFLLVILFTAGHSLSCYQCSSLNDTCANQTVQTCPNGSQCSSYTRVIQYGNITSKQKGKGCAFDCQSGSINVGYAKNTSSCCNTDQCNVQEPPDPSNVLNGKTCFSCDGQNCTNILNCSGSEDHCFINTGTFKNQSFVLKGCLSKSMCDSTTLVSNDTVIRCCEGNLCNGAQSATPSVSPSSMYNGTNNVTKSSTHNVTNGVSPSVTPSSTHNVTNGVSPSVTQSSTHNVTNGVSPSVTPSSTHNVTNGVSPSVTPSSTHNVTNGVSPSVTPSSTHNVTNGVSPSVTQSSTHNGAQSVTQSFLFLGCSLLSYFLLH